MTARTDIEILLPAAMGREIKESVRDQAGYLHDSVYAVLLDGLNLRLRLSQALGAEAQLALEKALAELVERTSRSFSKVRLRILADERGRPSFDLDPMPLLRETRQALELQRGTFALRGDLLRVVLGLDRFFRDYALGLGAEEQAYPTTVPLERMIRNGYLSNFPQHALMVAHLHRDFASLGDFARNPAAGELIEALSPPQQMLAPTVCYHCFDGMRGMDVKSTGNLFTATAHCHRHEGAATTGLVRLQTFLMREIIFFGTPTHIGEIKARIMEDVKRCFERWGIGFQLMTATDPFFAGSNEAKRAFQALQALKHELRARLPFSGTTIACASFNNHKDTLVRPYGIFDSRSDTLASGCVGLGFERIAYGLFAHFGMTLTEWPAALREDLQL